MINEEKVILMTKLASYETDNGKKDILVVNYFRSDYIGFQLLKSVIAATISFCALNMERALSYYICAQWERTGSFPMSCMPAGTAEPKKA